MWSICTRCTGWRGASLRSWAPATPAADGVVEDMDAVGPGCLLQDPLDLRVVDAAHLFVVEEVAHRAPVVHQGKAVGIERHLAGDWAGVVDGHLVRLMVRIAARHAGRRLERVVARPLGHRHEVVHVGFDVRQAGDDIGLQAHGHDLRDIPLILGPAVPRAMEKKCGDP